MEPIDVMVPRAGLKVRAMDCTLNTWDLARSIGVDPGVDPEVPAALIEFATGFLAKVRERDDHVRFGQPVSVDGTGLDALVALSGRNPAWQPPAS